MKKILIISHEFPPNIGGAGSVAKTIFQCLKDTYEVSVLTRKVINQDKTESRSIKRIKTFSGIFFVQYWFFLKRMLKEENFDYVILNDIGASMVGAFFFPLWLRRKTIVYFHGNEKEAVLDNFGLKMRLYKALYIRLLKSCKSLIFVSEFLMKKMLLNLGIDSLENKSTVLYSPLPDKLFYPVKSDLREKLSIADNKRIMLTVCRIVEQKGLQDILEMMLINHDLHWVLIGEGDFKSDLIASIEKNNLLDRFSYIPAIKRAELSYYYSGADFFVLLSDFEESFGLVYLEANACGIPVIGKNKGGVSEAICEGISGFVVNNYREASSKIIQLDTLSRSGILGYVKNFGIHRFSVEFKKVLEV